MLPCINTQLHYTYVNFFEIVNLHRLVSSNLHVKWLIVDIKFTEIFGVTSLCIFLSHKQKAESLGFDRHRWLITIFAKAEFQETTTLQVNAPTGTYWITHSQLVVRGATGHIPVSSLLIKVFACIITNRWTRMREM